MSERYIKPLDGHLESLLEIREEGSKIAPAPSANSAPEARLKWGSYETAVSRVAKPNGFLPLKLRYLGRARSGAGNARLIARVDHLALGNDVSWPDFFWHLLAGSESSIRPKSCAPRFRTQPPWPASSSPPRRSSLRYRRAFSALVPPGPARSGMFRM